MTPHYLLQQIKQEDKILYNQTGKQDTVRPRKQWREHFN